jgi:uncharacterized protein
MIGNTTDTYMRKFYILLFFFLISQSVFSQREIPELWGVRVHDEASVLSAQTVEQLEAQLKLHEDSTSNQIAILIIPSLDGEAIEDYALRVAEKWKLGQKDKDNGVLLLIAINDRKMRIEVGYGLEGVLPDAICNQIIRNEMAPNFRRGDYDAGVQAAINAIVQTIAGEYVVSDSDTGGENAPMTGAEKTFVGLFIFGILGMFTYSGLVTKGCAAWFLYAFLIPFYAIFPGLVFGGGTAIGILATYVVGFPILKLIFNKMGWTKTFESSGGSSGRSGGGWTSSSGWMGGGGFGGGGSSWGGGGGFSGGGGGFGGGGSSGSW